MNATRREFVRLGLGSCTLLSCGVTVPGFLARSAAATPSGDRSTGRVLVVLELSGGNDGLNTVVPYADDAYGRHRPRLRIPTGSLHKLDDHVGLHPDLSGLNELWDRGELAIVQSVGYPNPNRSHFESMDIWQTAMLEPDEHAAGWLNRGAGREAATGGGSAIHVGDREIPRALTGDALAVQSLEGLDQLVRRIGMPERGDTTAHRAALDRVARMPRGEAGSHLHFIQRSQVATYAGSARIEQILCTGGRQSGAGNPAAVGYPDTGLARRLRLVAQLIEAGLSTSIYYVQLEGFDTHFRQPDDHAALLLELGGAVSAFLGDLRRSKEAGRVLLLAFSEFGRRLAENAGRGTDHGTAAPVLLAGPSVRRGLHGPYPNLVDLQDGDIRFAVDFRRVYATILDRWLDCPSRPVLGAEFSHLDLIPAR
jgi:uncharacterized protein (DUF1501 family)